MNEKSEKNLGRNFENFSSEILKFLIENLQVDDSIIFRVEHIYRTYTAEVFVPKSYASSGERRHLVAKNNN